MSAHRHHQGFAIIAILQLRISLIEPYPLVLANTRRNNIRRLFDLVLYSCTARNAAVKELGIVSDVTTIAERREIVMSEQITSKVMSRRSAFSLFGLAALSLAALPTMLTSSEAEAEESVPQSGTARRQERRVGRTERRQERRSGRTERRAARRAGRTERRQERRTGGTQQ